MYIFMVKLCWIVYCLLYVNKVLIRLKVRGIKWVRMPDMRCSNCRLSTGRPNGVNMHDKNVKLFL
jgi:hypothetical protein